MQQAAFEGAKQNEMLRTTMRMIWKRQYRQLNSTTTARANMRLLKGAWFGTTI